MEQFNQQHPGGQQAFPHPYSNSMPVFNKQQQDLPQSVGH